MSDARKRDIAARFSAAEGYDDTAHLQRRCVSLLMDRIDAVFSEQSHTQNPARILEFGCGTGFLTARLAEHFPEAALCATDIAPGMIDRARATLPPPAARYRVMDAEHPPADLDGPFDLIASSLCLQWFTSPQNGIRRLCDHLAPQGLFMVTTLLQGSFAEWRQACAMTDAPCGIPDYPALTTLQSDWPETGAGLWTALPLIDRTGNARTFLRGLREIGASRPADDAPPASPAALRRAMAQFDALGGNVTYQIGLGIFRRNPV